MTQADYCIPEVTVVMNMVSKLMGGYKSCAVVQYNNDIIKYWMVEFLVS